MSQNRFTADSSGNPGLLDAEIISQLVFLSEDDPSFIPELIVILTRELKSFQTKSLLYIENQSFDEFERMAHKLCGACSNLGAASLEHQLRFLQEQIKTLGPMEMKIELEKTVQLADASLNELNKLFPTPKTEQT